MNKKKTIFIDMDGVICDYYGAFKSNISSNPKQNYPQSRWGFFLDLKPLKGAIEAIEELKKNYNVWILTRPSMMNINSYSEKAFWVQKNLGYEMLEKTILSPDKSLIIGDYLIDDQTNAGQEKFVGTWLHFGSEKYKDWDDVLKYFNQIYATS